MHTKMPVVPIFPTYFRIDTCVYENIEFSYEIYTNPHEQSQVNQDRCVEILANPKGHLGITETSVRERIRDQDFTAILFVRNTTADDQVSGSMQYFDWLDYGSPQALITDLCRITENLTGKTRSNKPVSHLPANNTPIQPGRFGALFGANTGPNSPPSMKRFSALSFNNND